MHLFFWSEKQLARLAVFTLIGIIAVVGMLGYLNNRVASVYRPYYHGMEAEKVVALTVNVDWGEEYLPSMLETLTNAEVKATFFLTGRWAQKNPDLTKAIYAAGHEIGNHGYSHPHPNKLTKQRNQQEIIRTQETIAAIIPWQTTVFAPPYGEAGTQVLEAAGELGYATILWTIDTVDWKEGTSSNQILQRVFGSKLKPGAIVLIHPTANTAKALPKMITGLREKGYQFRTVSEIIGK